jgi:CTP synthase (UTP-ammonia lyase)
VGGWRRPHNEELHNLYASPHIIRMIQSRRMRWAGHMARMGEMRNTYKILIGISEWKSPLGRHRHRYEVNIRMHLREIG